MLRPASLLLSSALIASVATSARADLQDEIQVYDDSINAPGQLGLELHVNTTPEGRSQPLYPGEVVPNHGWRFTPEFSLGMTRSVELGAYLPLAMSPQGQLDVAGAKLRLKWLPFQPTNGEGAFGGVNFELSRLAERYSLPRSSIETRFIGGWRSADWLIAVNPIFDFGLSDGYESKRPDFYLDVKVARRAAPGLMAGFEYYMSAGPLGQPLPWEQQDNRLYVALDVDRAPWVFNLALGRGLTQAADRWTIKAIFELPLERWLASLKR